MIAKSRRTASRLVLDGSLGRKADDLLSIDDDADDDDDELTGRLTMGVMWGEGGELG